MTNTVRLRRVCVRLLIASAVLTAAPAAAQTARNPCREAPYVLKLGYTTFERPETVHTDSTLHSLGDYLRRVATQSCTTGPWKRPLEFDVMLGNYYQIWSWFRSGQIDAAVVSPFMAILLQRDAQ